MKSMKNYLSILLIFIFIRYSYAEQYINPKNEVNSTWTFLKVSEKDLFGDKSNDTLQALNTLYSQVKITINDKKLTINNLLLEKDQVCSIDYIKIKKTPLAYFYSQKTTDLYKALFSQENIPLSSQIYILTASKPELECKEPYNEIIENDGYLVVIAQDHLLFFKKLQDQEGTSFIPEKHLFKDEFPKYCQDMNKGQIFDGSNKYVCNYPNKTIFDIYARMKKIMDDGKFMKQELPTTNTSFSMQAAKVTYHWIKPSAFILTIAHDSETTTYQFEETKDGTKLVVNVETGY